MSDQRCAVYVRISSDPEGQRAGVERQRVESLALAERLGLDVIDVYEDNDTSAYSGKPRPEFERLMGDAAGGEFGHVIAWASDRLYRRMGDLVRISETFAGRVDVHTVAGGDVDLDTAEGLLRAQVLGSVAEFESRRKGERQRARIRQRVEAGVGTASIRPRGWQWADGCPGGEACQHTKDHAPGERPRRGSRAGLILHPEEAPILAAAYRRILDGWSLAAAYREAADAGLPIADVATLRANLLSARNAGHVAHKGVIVSESANGLAIIDPETHARVSAILSDPRRRTTTGRPSATPLGGGLLRCPACAGPMAASNKHNRTGSVTPVYLCSRNRCHTRARHLLDAPVLDLVGEVLAALAEQGVLIASTDDTGPVASLRAEIAEREARLTEAAGLAATGALDVRDFAALSSALRADLETLTARLTRRAGKPALGALAADPDGITAAYTRVRQQCADGQPEPLRAVLREVLEAVTFDVGTGDPLLTWKIPGPLPERITPATPPPPRREARRAAIAAAWGEGIRTTVALAAHVGTDRKTVRQDLAALGLRDVAHRGGPRPAAPAPLPALAPVRLSGEQARTYAVDRTRDGYGRTEIARALGVNRSTVLQWVRDAGIAPARQTKGVAA